MPIAKPHGVIADVAIQHAAAATALMMPALITSTGGERRAGR